MSQSQSGVSQSQARKGQKRLLSGKVTQQDRLRTRTKYTILKKDILDHHEEMLDVNRDLFKEALTRADDTLQEVAYPSEFVKDTNVIQLLGKIGREQAKKCGSGALRHTVDEVVKVVKRRWSSEEGEDVDWARLGRLAGAFIRSVEAPAFLSGPIGVEHVRKERAVRQKKKKADIAPLERPRAELDQTEDEKTQNDQEIAKVRNLLQETGEIPYFKFVINPNSYTETIENMFHVSFILSKGHCTLFRKDDEDDTLYLAPKNAPTPKDHDIGLPAKQCVAFMDVRTFMDLVEEFDVKKPIIPDRYK